MKKYIWFPMLVFLLINCSSPRQLIKNGRYDDAVKVLVKKLRIKPENEKHISDFLYAYRVANKINHDSLNMLKQSGQPDIWYAIYENYNALKLREDLIKTLPETVLEKIEFKYLDFSKDIENAKMNAATYLYAHAEKLLKNESKQDARQAYDELLKVTKLYDDYRETDELLRKALVMGTDYILYKVENNSASVLPQSFIYELNNLNLQGFDELFIRFDNYRVSGRTYNYELVLDLRSVMISPEKFKESHYVESKKVVEDYEVKKDNEGNVVKDETGNPVKIPLYKTISCKITEFVKLKSAKVDAWVSFYKSDFNTVVNTTPITAETHFSNIHAVAKGDIRACSEKTLQLLNQPKLPFPSNTSMLQDLSVKLKRAVKQVIWTDEKYME